MDRKIVWESIHQELPPLENYEYDPSEEHDDGDDDDNDIQSQLMIMGEQTEMSITPFGSWPVADQLNPFRQYYFWLGHTTFELDDISAHKIAAVEGVEVVHILSRYRFILACAKLFNEQEVKINIQNELCGYATPKDDISQIANVGVRQIVSDTIEKLRTENDYWAVYVFPNGKMITFGFQEVDQFNEKLIEYKDIQVMSGGILITC